MKIKIRELQEITKNSLLNIGFQKDEATIVANHLVDAEVSGKKGHGVSRVKYFKDKLGSELFDPTSAEPKIEKETKVSWRINGYKRSGIYTIEKFLAKAINKAKDTGIFSVASTFGVNSGTIGLYAQKAAEENLIYLGFHNSSGGLIPYGASKDIWGTNPFTVGIPSQNLPVVLDFATTKITYGEVLEAMYKGKKLPKNTILDDEGNPSEEPEDAWKGGIMAFANHKGSGLGMVVELLAGALSLSRVGWETKGGWGSFYILINPEIFLPVEDFNKTVSKAIDELKSLPKAQGFNEIFFPGERSQKNKLSMLKSGEVEINDQTISQLKENK